MPEFMGEYVPVNTQWDNLEAAATAPPIAGIIENDDDKLVVRYPRCQRVIDERTRVGASFQPAMRPGTTKDISQRSVFECCADDRIIAGIIRRPVLIVHPGADAGVLRYQVDPEDIEGLFILIKVIISKYAINQKLLYFLIVKGLIRFSEPIAKHGYVYL
jgi:hypothetical protein